MKKLRKKILSLLTAMMMLLSIVAIMPNSNDIIFASADNNIIIAGIDIGYGNGSYFTKNGQSCATMSKYWTNGRCHHNGVCDDASSSKCNCMRYWPTGNPSTCQVDLLASQCFGFARYCEWKVYGLHEKQNNSGFVTTVGQTSSSNCSASYLKEKLYGIAAASHLRTGNDTHSLVIVTTSDSGLTWADCNSDGYCKVVYHSDSWSSFSTYIKGKNGILYVKSKSNGIPSNQNTPQNCNCNDSYAGIYEVTANGGLKIRSAHSTNSGEIGLIPQGAQCSVTKGDGSWAHVSYNGISGYSSMQYLRLVQSANHSPIGNVDLVEGGEGKVHIRGWTFDEDDSYKSLEIHVYIGGPYNGHPDLVHATGGIMADNSSTDVTNVYNVGGNHRFDTWIDTSARGNQNIYIYAIDANDSSGNKLIGSGTANITEPIPQGTEMTSGAGQTIPDGDYIIVSELGRRIYLDIPGTQCPADGGIDVAICASSTLPDKSGYFDTWTVSYIEDGFYKITQKGTDVSLDVKNDSKAVGTEIITCEYHDGHNQQWSISSSSHGYTIQSRSTSWYLDVRDAGTATGTKVQTCGKNGSKAQSWGFIPVDSDDRPIADGKYFIKSAAGDVYLDADGDKNYVNGSNIQVWGGNTDSYNVTYAENGFYTICETSSGLAVEVDDEDKTAFLNKNKNVQLGTFTSERRQLWKIVDEGDGKYRLVSKLSGYSLDLQNALTADGTNVADHPYNTTNAQKWYFEPVDSINPEITDVQVTDVSGTGYTVTCKVTDDGGSGLDRVQFPTWTTNNGQDDIQASWQTNSIASGTIDGDTVTFRVNVSDHGNEHGTYRTHIYAYDKHNNSAKAKVDDIEIPHIYKEETVPANCTTNGTKTYTCEICGDTYTEEIPATGHKFKETIIAPTETSQGYTLHDCEYCDYSYRSDYTNMVYHNFTSQVTKEATCKEDGVRTYVCSDCGDSYNEIIPAIGHSYYSKVIDPTCTDKGYTLHTCSKCGDTYKTDYKNEKGHTYRSSVTKNASCEDDGITTYTCEKCGSSYTALIPSFGHTWTEPIYTWSADNKKCTATRVCKNDATHFETETVNAASSVRKPATCDEMGQTRYTSEFKNNAFYTQLKVVTDIPKTSHNWSEPTYIWSSDNKKCTATRVCENDTSHVETETVNVTSTVKKTATCEEMGQTKYTAEFNNLAFDIQIKTVTDIPKISHIAGTTVIENEKPATCTEKGSYDEVVYCTKCHAEMSRETKMTEALGHTWGEWTVTTPATADEEGVETSTCDICSKTETKIIPKLEKQPDLYTYTVTETEWSKDSDEATTIIIHRITDDDKTFENFKSVEIDDKVVSSENYTAKAGSLILTFKPEFLKTLSDGEHIVKVNFTDGDAELKLRVSETSEYVLGDVSGDGKITITDITKVAAHVKGKKLLSKEQQKRADVNRDNKLTITDITKIAAHVKGKKLLAY